MAAEFPYNGTTGFVRGSDTSQERAEEEVRSGAASKRQTEVMRLLDTCPDGLTWFEAGQRLGLHHGQISGTLSVLHKAGKVVQVKRKRGRSYPYISARFADLYSPAEVIHSPSATSAGQHRQLLQRVAEASELYLAEPDLWTEQALRDALADLRSHDS